MTTQLLQSPNNTILAACRTPSEADALQALAASAGSERLHILRLGVNNTQSIKDAAREAAQILGEKGVDHLVNNAGIVSRLVLAFVALPTIAHALTLLSRYLRAWLEPWRN